MLWTAVKFSFYGSFSLTCTLIIKQKGISDLMKPAEGPAYPIGLEPYKRSGCSLLRGGSATL